MNHSQKKNLARWGSVSSLLFLAIVFTQCIPSTPKKLSSSNYSQVEVSSPGGLEQAEAEAPSVGVKDADRILYSMAAVTGVSPTANNIRNAFTNLNSQLPTNSRLESLTENQMVAVTKLAAEFCNELVNSSAMRQAVWPTSIVDFTRAWNNAAAFPNETKRGAFIATTLETFWGADVQDPQNYEESFEVLLDLMSEMLDGSSMSAQAPTNNATPTLNAGKAVCTTVLASAPVWMN